MGSIPDKGLVVIGNRSICNLELGSGMGEEEYVWSVTSVELLEFAGSCVSVNI
jgi:hypothetical protein